MGIKLKRWGFSAVFAAFLLLLINTWQPAFHPERPEQQVPVAANLLSHSVETRSNQNNLIHRVDMAVLATRSQDFVRTSLRTEKIPNKNTQ